MTAADVLVEALIDWGVEVIFGLPGDGINGIMESLRTHQEKFDLFRCGTRRLLLSWHVATPSSREGWESVSPHRARGAYIC